MTAPSSGAVSWRARATLFMVVAPFVACGRGGCDCVTIPDISCEIGSLDWGDGGLGYYDGGPRRDDPRRLDATPPPPPEPRLCDVGARCASDRECPSSDSCIRETFAEIGGASDPIVGLPSGADGFAVVRWAEGYCTDSGELGAGGCDPLDDESCGGLDCARCLETGHVASSGSPTTFCARTCVPSLDASPCASGYACTLDERVCLPGCVVDLECQLRREDSNENGVLDPYDAATLPEGDRLVYDPSANGRCDTVTWRCRHDGTPGARAGTRCYHDFECEADGICVDAPSGCRVCTKLGCELPGNECALGGKCMTSDTSPPRCVAPCEVGATVDGTPLGAARDCPAGDVCRWDRTSGPGPDNGGCVPGETTPVAEPNVGAPCATVADCYSPYGAGECRALETGARCTVVDCGAPGVPPDVCGDGAVCTGVSGDVATACLQTCLVASDCPIAGDGCWDPAAAGVLTPPAKICFPGCRDDAHCRAGERCADATDGRVGACVRAP